MKIQTKPTKLIVTIIITSLLMTTTKAHIVMAQGNTDLSGATVSSTNDDLTLNTGTLTHSDLSNRKISKTIGIGASSNSGSIGYNTQNSKTKTLSTIGSGTINIKDQTNSSDTTKLNRDTDNSKIDIYDVKREVSVSAQVDANLLTEQGRKKIAEDILKTEMIADTIKQIATNETLGIIDFFSNTDKEHKTYEAIIAKDPNLAKALNSDKLTDNQKELMMDEITNTVMKELGYDTAQHDNKLISTDQTGRDGKQIKGFYSTQTKDSYINEKNINNGNEGLVEVSGTEMQRAIDNQNGSNFDQSDSYRSDRASYSQNVGTNIKDYTNFALDYTGQGSISNTDANSKPSVFSEHIANNNYVFSTLDKTKGDNMCLNSTDCYGKKTNKQFQQATIKQTPTKLHNYDSREVIDKNGKLVGYSLYNEKTNNTIIIKPQELSGILNIAKDPEKFKNIMATYEMQSNVKHTSYNAVTGLHDNGMLGGTGDAYKKYVTSGDILFDMIGGGTAIKVSGVGKVGKTSSKNANVINKNYGEPPYKKDTKVYDIKTGKEQDFVRVHNGGKSETGYWLARKKDIEGLSPKQIQEKFNLPDTPKYISDVKVPKETKVRVGKVGKNKWGTSEGANQYELQERIPKSSYTNQEQIKK